MRKCVSCEAVFAPPTWLCSTCGYEPPVIDGVRSFVAKTDAGGFRAEDFNALEKLEGRHFWFRGRNRLILWALWRYLPGTTRFLEIGCGTGFVMAGIQDNCPGIAVAGSDIFEEALAVARRRLPRAELFCADSRRLPFVDEYDVIGAFDTIEHIREDEDVLAQCYRALRPGGGLMVTVPQHPSLWSATDIYSCHQRRYTRKDLCGKLRRVGFEISRATSFMTFLTPALWFSRHARKRPDDPLAELKIPAPVNAVCERVLGVERRLITAGVSLPVGVSLLVVARRP